LKMKFSIESPDEVAKGSCHMELPDGFVRSRSRVSCWCLRLRCLPYFPFRCW